jgi:hypothetical protein
MFLSFVKKISSTCERRSPVFLAFKTFTRYTSVRIFRAPTLNFFTFLKLVMVIYLGFKPFFYWAIIRGDAIVPLMLILSGTKKLFPC